LHPVERRTRLRPPLCAPCKGRGWRRAHCPGDRPPDRFLGGVASAAVDRLPVHRHRTAREQRRRRRRQNVVGDEDYRRQGPHHRHARELRHAAGTLAVSQAAAGERLTAPDGGPRFVGRPRGERYAGRDVQGELTEEEKRDNVIRLAFAGRTELYEEFCNAIREVIPPETTVVLRGSAVTGTRWKDGAPFDADGPGTSDLDLTLVGNDVIHFFKATGFFVPGVHSRPMGAADPDIAPD